MYKNDVKINNAFLIITVGMLFEICESKGKFRCNIYMLEIFNFTCISTFILE